jgi:hypothetical protein
MPRGVSRLDEARHQRRLWTPAMLAGGLRAWADFGDIPLLGLTGGEARAVRDKGRMGTWAYVTSGPTYSAFALNNRPAVSFGLAPSLVSDTATDCTPPLVATIIVSLSEATQGYGRVLGIAATDVDDYGSTSACALILRNVWNHQITIWYNGAARATAAYTFDTPHIISVEISAAGAVTIYIDGVSAATGSGITSTNWTAVRGLISCYKTDGSGEDIAGAYGEAVIFTGAQYQRARLLIEGYMAWRWGLPNLLGGAHQYRNAPPLIGA